MSRERENKREGETERERQRERDRERETERERTESGRNLAGFLNYCEEYHDKIKRATEIRWQALS